MDIGETPVSLPSLIEINNELQNLTNDAIKTKLTQILADISDHYGIARNELMTRYMSESFSSTETPVKKQRKALPTSDRCIAKIASGEQCSRRHKPDSQYCGSHVASRPFGEIKLT